MRALMLYAIAGMLFVAAGYQHCPGDNPLSRTTRQYAVNITLWPASLVIMIFDSRFQTCAPTADREAK